MEDMNSLFNNACIFWHGALTGIVVFGLFCAIKSAEKKLNVYCTTLKIVACVVISCHAATVFAPVLNQYNANKLKEVCIQNGITDPAKIESIMFLKYAKH